MINRLFNRNKQFISGIIAASMALTTLTSIPVKADAATTKTYDYDDYSISQLRVKSDNDVSVDFEIESELENSFIGKIKIINSSENDIVSWQLAFAADFRINQSDDFNIITDLSDYYIVEGTDLSVIPANSSIELVFNGEKNADTASLYFDYLSEVVPSYTIDSENLSQYYNVCNYSNNEFPLDMGIVVDENTLDFDINNSQVMGIPYWNTDNLDFSIMFDINENFSEIVDYEFVLCYNESQTSYKSFLSLSDIEIDTAYDYNLNVTNADGSISLYAGSMTVSTDIYNNIFILNDFSEVVPPINGDIPSVMASYSNLSDTDLSVSGSSLYNNESMSCALNMKYDMTNITSICGVGLIRNANDGDYYALTASANSKITATLYCPSGKNYCLYILDSSGTVRASKTSTGNKTISLLNSSSSSATYYVLVCGYGWKENGQSSYYSNEDEYSLNICVAKSSKVWFGQQEYAVGSYLFWNGSTAQNLYINNKKYFTTGWSSVTGEAKDLMEEGCNLTAIAMVLRNLGKSTVSEKYDFRTYYTGYLPADPYTVTLSNINSNGKGTRTSSSRFDLTSSVGDVMYVQSYSNIANDFGATYNGNTTLSGTSSAKADQIMNYLNSGYGTQGVIVRTNGHSIVVFKSNTPTASNYADRFYVYDPASTLYSDGIHKWSSETTYTLANATSVILYS